MEKTWQPQMTAAVRDELVAGWHKAVERTYHWVD
jgi:glycerol kinase